MGAMLDTLAAPASHLLEVKHSRFLANATPIGNAADALACAICHAHGAGGALGGLGARRRGGRLLTLS